MMIIGEGIWSVVFGIDGRVEKEVRLGHLHTSTVDNDSLLIAPF